MAATGVVESLYEVEDRHSCLGVSAECVSVNRNLGDVSCLLNFWVIWPL